MDNTDQLSWCSSFPRRAIFLCCDIQQNLMKHLPQNANTLLDKTLKLNQIAV